MAFTSLRGKVKILKRRPTQSSHNVPSHLAVLTCYHSLSASALFTLVSSLRAFAPAGPAWNSSLKYPQASHILEVFAQISPFQAFLLEFLSILPLFKVASPSGLSVPLILLYFSQVLPPDNIQCNLSITFTVSSHIKISAAGGQEYFIYFIHYHIPSP